MWKTGLVPRASSLFKAIFVMLSLYFVLTASPLAYYYAAPLYVQSNPRRSDVIVLMSSGQLDPDWLTPDAAQRTLGALKLFREQYASRIISSGSQFRAGRHQAELQAIWLERAGVPAASILIEGRSSRTYESGVEVAQIMAAHGWKSAAVVTSQMDVPRLNLVFRKLGVETSFLAVPEFNRPKGLDYVRSALPVAYHATYEYAGLILYKFKGWI